MRHRRDDLNDDLDEIEEDAELCDQMCPICCDPTCYCDTDEYTDLMEDDDA